MFGKSDKTMDNKGLLCSMDSYKDSLFKRALYFTQKKKCMLCERISENMHFACLLRKITQKNTKQVGRITGIHNGE